MIRRCTHHDRATILEIVNDAAEAYRGVIPPDRWNDPYMPASELREEMADGVEFWGLVGDTGELIGVMGIQDRGEVTLIRHAYVRTTCRRGGVGSQLLRHLETLTDKPILIGTWAAATWAIGFYRKNGYRQVGVEEKTRLLRQYWRIPERQVETSVVLAKRLNEE
jgi:N-acetylglutamate synthase-like GNAT family acetyltransferase